MMQESISYSNFPVNQMEKQRAMTAVASPIHGASFINFDHGNAMVGTNNYNYNKAQQQLQQQQQHKPVICIQPVSSQQSPCSHRPCYLVPNHFFANQTNFFTIKTMIETTLMTLQENVKYLDCIDYAFFSKECQYRMKYVNGSDYREIHINCYWDDNANDHIIEMNRVRGDGMSPTTNDFYETLRQTVLGEKYTPPVVVPGRRPMMAGPPPMLLKRAIESGAVPKLPAVSEEQFLKGVNPVFSMAEDDFFEPRLSAAKSLCDMAKRDIKLLSLPECQNKVIHAVNALLKDEFEEIRQFAVIACARFAGLSADYKIAMSKMNGVHVLMNTILEAPVNEQVGYETAHMRRRACVALSEMIVEDAEGIRNLLEQHGVYSFATLEERCSHIPLRLVSNLELCFI